MTNEITRLKEERDRLRETRKDMLPVEGKAEKALAEEAKHLDEVVRLAEYNEKYESFAFIGALRRRDKDPELGMVPHYAVFDPYGSGLHEIKATITRSRLSAAKHEVTTTIAGPHYSSNRFLGFLTGQFDKYYSDLLTPESLGLIKRALFFLLKPVKWALTTLDNGWVTVVHLVSAALLALPISISVAARVASATVTTGGGVMVGILAELLCLFIIALILVPVVIWLQAERREYRYLRASFEGIIPEKARDIIVQALGCVKDEEEEVVPAPFSAVYLLCPVERWGYKEAPPVKADPIIIGEAEIGGSPHYYKLDEFDARPVEEVLDELKESYFE